MPVAKRGAKPWVLEVPFPKQELRPGVWGPWQGMSQPVPQILPWIRDPEVMMGLLGSVLEESV